MPDHVRMSEGEAGPKAARYRVTSFVTEGPAATKWEAEFGRMWDSTSIRIDKLTLKQRLTARLCEYLNRKDYAFW